MSERELISTVKNYLKQELFNNGLNEVSDDLLEELYQKYVSDKNLFKEFIYGENEEEINYNRKKVISWLEEKNHNRVRRIPITKIV